MSKNRYEFCFSYKKKVEENKVIKTKKVNIFKVNIKGMGMMQ